MTPEERRTAARIHARQEIEASFPNPKEAIASPVFGRLYKNHLESTARIPCGPVQEAASLDSQNKTCLR